MYFVRKLIGGLARKVWIVGLLIALCQPITAHAEDGESITEEVAAEGVMTEEAVTDEVVAEEPVVEEIATEEPAVLAEVELAAIEGATMLGEFRFTYYCCELHKHICGDGKGLTASGRPVEAGRTIAVDPEVIPLGSRVWIDFDDGEGWHEYLADDVGPLVKDNHIDIAIATHREALRQKKVAGRVCYMPPQDFQELLDGNNPADSGDFS